MPDWIFAVLESPAAVSAAVGITAGLLAIFWPPAGAFVLRLLPVARQIPELVKAVRRRPDGGLDEVTVSTAAERTVAGAGPVSKAVVRVVGKRAVKAAVRKAARKRFSGQGIPRF